MGIFADDLFNKAKKKKNSFYYKIILYLKLLKNIYQDLYLFIG